MTKTIIINIISIPYYLKGTSYDPSHCITLSTPLLLGLCSIISAQSQNRKTDF
jgi:hypothetical protein